MDRFILLSTLLVFGGLIQSTWSAVMLKGQKNAMVERIDRWSRAVYPLLLVLVLVYSFVI